MFGVKLKADDLIIDIDPRNMKGEKVWTRLKEQVPMLHEAQQKATIVKTAGGGLHIYLRKPANFNIRKVIRGFPGIEFLSKGAYVIGAGSIREQDKNYQFLTPPFEPVEAPGSLLELLKRDVIDSGIERHTGFSDSKPNIERFIEYLTEHAPPAIEGEQGDQTTFKVACRGRDYNLTPNKTWALMYEHYNPRCEPPWDRHDLHIKVNNAYTYNEAMPGKNDPNVVFSKELNGPDGKWHTALDRYKTKGKTADGRKKLGALKPTLRNAVEIIKNEVGIQGKFSLNEFTERIDVKGLVPWEDARINRYREVNDREIELIRLYLAQTYGGVEFSSSTTWKAIDIVAAGNRHHPVRDHIESLSWDGVRRLDTWLIDYCGVSDTPLHRQMGRKFLLAMINRVYEPGCKWDYVLVLEGKQGIGKSTLCSLLGGEWFGDAPIDPRDKDSVPYLHAHWVIELAEMAITRKDKSDSLKNFLSRTEDDIRKPYARERSKYPRQCVFLGTINPDSVGYLYDGTGNRRFWCVFCRDIDYIEFGKVRNLLIAEAYNAYITEERLLMSPKLMAEAEESAQTRLAGDPWEGIIHEYLENQPELDSISTQEIYEACLGGHVWNMTMVHQRRIAQALQSYGFVKKRLSSGNRYMRPIKHEMGVGDARKES
jgi:predicted P-loop ATPase